MPRLVRLLLLPVAVALLHVWGGASAVGAPSAPASLSVAPSAASGEVTLSWAPSPGAEAYVVRRAPAVTGPFTTLATGVGSTTFVDAGGTPGVFAYYIVFATDATGESPASSGVWAAPALVLDNAPPGGSAPGVAYIGAWAASSITGSHGTSSVFAAAVSGATPTATYTFTPTIPARGRYDVYLRWTAAPTRAPAAPFDLQTHDEARTLLVDQRINGSAWNFAASLVCEPGSVASVTLRNNGTTGNVVADAVQFVPRHAPLAPEAERPRDYSVPVFHDPFEGSVLNVDLWKQFLDRPHFSVSEGKLRLRLVWSGPVPLAQASAAQIADDTNWSEGGIVSQHSQKFGYHEARFRIPPASARGVDTAYWHAAADAVLSSYEIDAPEFFNKDSSGVRNNFGFGVWDHTPPTRQVPGLHYGRTWDYTADNSTLAAYADVSGFITVGLEWRTDNTQVVYVNGRKLYEAPASGMNDVDSVLPTNAILSTKILSWMNPGAGLDGAEALWDYALYYQKPGWLGAASTDWTDPANWGPDGLPGPGRAAVFNLPPPSTTITVPADQSLASLSLDGATLPALTFSGPGALRLGASSDPTLGHGGILLNTAVSTDQTFALPIVGVQHLQFANLSRTPGATLRLNGLISGDGVAPRDIDFVSSTAANTALGAIELGQPLGPDIRHVNRAGDCAFTLPAGSRHSGELRLARGTLILPDATALGLDPAAAIVFRPNSKHSEPFRPRLRYLGPAATLARPIVIGGFQADAIIESNGTGPLTLAGPVVLQPSSTDPKKVITRDLRLALNALASSGENILAAPLSDLDLAVTYLNSDGTPNTAPATLTLTKSGAGTWVFTGENHLAEPVTIWAGRLVIGQGTSGGLHLRTSPRTGAAPAMTVQSGAELIFGRDDAVAFSTPIGGAGALRKRGAGVLTLAGAHGFTGPATVQAGTLRLDGNLNGGGTLTVSAGAALTGSGTSAGATNIDGTLVASPLTFGGNINLRANSTLRAAFAANAAPTSAPLASAGLVIGSGVRVDIALDAPGSTADLRHVFWRSPRVFPLLSASSRTGTLVLGTVSADSAGNAVSAFGAFSLRHTATGAELLWTPTPGYPNYDYVTLDLASPAAPVVSLPDPDHALRLSVVVGGGTLDTLAWTLLSGPGSATFANPSAPDTTVVFSAPGTYVLRLAATNVLGPVNRDLTVNVAPPPVLVLRESAAPASHHPATFIRSDNPAWNSGARDQILVGRNNAAFRSLLAFALPALPPGATLEAAELELWAAASGLGTSVGPLDLHRLLLPFGEGAGDGVNAANGTGTGADWSHRAPSAPWFSAGAASDTDRDPAPLATLPALNPTAADIAGTRLHFASTPGMLAAVQQALAAVEPVRLLLKASADTAGTNGFLRLASDDHAAPALRPRLTLALRHAFAPAILPGAAPLAIAGQPTPLAGSAGDYISTLWTLVAGPAAPDFADATAVSTTATFPAPGDYVLRLSAANAHGESSRLLAVNVRPERAAWRQMHFGTTADAGPAADLADPDADGVPNLLEYAFAGDPLAPTSDPGVHAANFGEHLQLTFLRARAELIYLVEASSDLANWSVIATNPGAVSLAAPVTVTDPETVSTWSRRFLRVRIVAP